MKLIIEKVIGANEWFVGYTDKKGYNQYPFNGTKKECKEFAESFIEVMKNKEKKKKNKK